METAIIGIGCLSSLGKDVDEVWSALNECTDCQNIIYNTQYEFFLI